MQTFFGILEWYVGLSVLATLWALAYMFEQDIAKWNNPRTRYDIKTPYFYTKDGFWQLALLLLPILNLPVILVLAACALASWDMDEWVFKMKYKKKGNT